IESKGSAMGFGNSFARPVGHLRLDFGNDTGKGTVGNLSAIEQIGDTLWLADDESAGIDRLVTADYANYTGHRRFALSDFFALPGGPDQEVDLEGLGVDRERSRLWMAGSHSLRRGKPTNSNDEAAAAMDLSRIDRQANRFLLGYVEINAGTQTPEPLKGSAAALPFYATTAHLCDMLRGDPLLFPFLTIPSKDNGFDIEGLAVSGDTVFLGLRGPVLRGWGIVLQLCLDPNGNGGLVPRLFNADNRGYLRHLVDLGGLGVCDLCLQGDDLLILAGPTMALDGPVKLFRWRNAVHSTFDRRIDGNGLQLLFEIPSGDRVDHAEGIALFMAPDQEPRLVIVYDSPARSRQHDGKYFEADLFAIR
ncbi:MAG: DUF3616 domain-containing protein, partial [Paracoccaceae bacterium]